MSLTHIILALIFGSFVGSVLGFVGAGGAMITVPILLYVFHFNAQQATTAALAVVFIAAFFGLIPKIRTKDVLYREALSIWAIGLVTNIGGALLSKHLSAWVITGGFAAVLSVAGASMLRGPVKVRPERKMPLGALIATSLLIGLMTGLFGIGGGFLAMPILILFYNTPQSKAAGTSLFIIAINCSTSFLGHHSAWAEVKWGIPLVIGIAAIIVSTLTSHYSSRVPTDLLRKSFAYLLFALSIFTIIKTVIAK